MLKGIIALLVLMALVFVMMQNYASVWWYVLIILLAVGIWNAFED